MGFPWKGGGSLARMDVDERLALEMALHEEQERRAMMEGELRLLERAWQGVEEIAVIAHDLLTPSSVAASIRRHRDR